MRLRLVQTVLRSVLWQLLVEKPEETAIVVVQIVDQLVRIPGTRGVRGRARSAVTAGVVSQQGGPAEHKQWRIVHEIQHGE